MSLFPQLSVSSTTRALFTCHDKVNLMTMQSRRNTLSSERGVIESARYSPLASFRTSARHILEFEQRTSSPEQSYKLCSLQVLIFAPSRPRALTMPLRHDMTIPILSLLHTPDGYMKVEKCETSPTEGPVLQTLLCKQDKILVAVNSPPGTISGTFWLPQADTALSDNRVLHVIASELITAATGLLEEELEVSDVPVDEVLTIYPKRGGRPRSVMFVLVDVVGVPDPRKVGAEVVEAMIEHDYRFEWVGEDDAEGLDRGPERAAILRLFAKKKGLEPIRT